jgi:hypothetical protein
MAETVAAQEASSESIDRGSATNAWTSDEPHVVSPSPTTWVVLAKAMNLLCPPI